MTAPAFPTDPLRPLAWITGAGGLIGHALADQARCLNLPWKIRPLTRQDVDLTDLQTLRSLHHRENPALILHCAALSRTPACEADPAQAHRQNVEVTQNLLALAEHSVFVFFSTDLVFDGRKGGYSEDDPVNPLGVYAETKVAAETLVRQHPDHLIIRTSLNLGRSPTGDRSFNEQLRRAWTEGRTTRLFTDEYRSPIPAIETARLTWGLLLAGARGTFHLAGRDRLSRWDLGRLLAEHWPELTPRMEPASQKEHTGPPRPPDTSLNCAKAERWLKQPMPSLREWLATQPPYTL